jgi:hypothetical protein
MPIHLQISAKPATKFAPVSPTRAAAKSKKKSNDVTAEQLQEIREAFNLFDTDNSGISRFIHYLLFFSFAACILAGWNVI